MFRRENIKDTISIFSQMRKESGFVKPEGVDEIFMEVSTFTMHRSVFLRLDYAFGKALLNGAPIEMDVKAFVKAMMLIVSSWEEEMVNDFIIDGKSYGVRFERNGKYYSFYGRNKFPDNYGDFSRLLKTYGVE